MTRQLSGWALRLLSLFLVFVIAIVAVLALKNLGWLSFIGVNSESHDSQVITAIERTQEVSLLSLGVQGILEESKNTEVGGWGIPLTEETLFLQYNFKAKLGLDGKGVKVAETGENTFRITVPEFSFIGYDEPTFKVAVEDGSALSWVTPDIDEVELINRILSDDARVKYLESNQDLLEEQTKVFYDSLITSVV